MSDTSPVPPHVPVPGAVSRRVAGPAPRVRHQVRDQVLVMLFTLGASVLLTLLLTLVAR